MTANRTYQVETDAGICRVCISMGRKANLMVAEIDSGPSWPGPIHSRRIDARLPEHLLERTFDELLSDSLNAIRRFHGEIIRSYQLAS